MIHTQHPSVRIDRRASSESTQFCCANTTRHDNLPSINSAYYNSMQLLSCFYPFSLSFSWGEPESEVESPAKESPVKRSMGPYGTECGNHSSTLQRCRPPLPPPPPPPAAPPLPHSLLSAPSDCDLCIEKVRRCHVSRTPPQKKKHD